MTVSKTHAPVAPIVWLDPGESTGIAVLAIDPGWLAGQGPADWSGLNRAIKQRWFAQVGFDAREWHNGKAVNVQAADFPALPASLYNGPSKIKSEYANELQQIAEIRAVLDAWPGACWGFETYRPESMAAAQFDPLIAMRIPYALAFGAIVDDTRARQPFEQSRNFKTTASDGRIKEAGLYLPGMPHATDAARHAAVFARRARQNIEIRAQAWPRLFGETRKRA